MDVRMERGFLAKRIIGKNPSPKTFFIGTVINITVVTLIIIYAPVGSLYVIFGMLFMVNFYHLIMIGDTERNWNNESYWKIRKDIMRTKKY